MGTAEELLNCTAAHTVAHFHFGKHFGDVAKIFDNDGRETKFL